MGVTTAPFPDGAHPPQALPFISAHESSPVGSLRPYSVPFALPLPSLHRPLPVALSLSPFPSRLFSYSKPPAPKFIAFP